MDPDLFLKAIPWQDTYNFFSSKSVKLKEIKLSQTQVAIEKLPQSITYVNWIHD